MAALNPRYAKSALKVLALLCLALALGAWQDFRGRTINPKFVETFEMFLQNGYEAWTINKSMRRLELPEVRQMAADGKKTYSGHNILFVEPGKHPELPLSLP